MSASPALWLGGTATEPKDCVHTASLLLDGVCIADGNARARSCRHLHSALHAQPCSDTPVSTTLVDDLGVTKTVVSSPPPSPSPDVSPRFRFDGSVSVHRRVLPCKHRKTLEMLFKLIKSCAMT